MTRKFGGVVMRVGPLDQLDSLPSLLSLSLSIPRSSTIDQAPWIHRLFSSLLDPSSVINHLSKMYSTYSSSIRHITLSSRVFSSSNSFPTWKFPFWKKGNSWMEEISNRFSDRGQDRRRLIGHWGKIQFGVAKRRNRGRWYSKGCLTGSSLKRNPCLGLSKRGEDANKRESVS